MIKNNQQSKILIIEDNDTNLYLMRFLLEQNGYAVIEAKTGLQGIELAAKEKPDLILMDIQLPDIDGLEVTRRIRNLDCGMRNEEESKFQIPNSKMKQLPILAVTSYAMVGDRERALEAGCTGYIEKPIDPETFIQEIREHL